MERERKKIARNPEYKDFSFPFITAMKGCQCGTSIRYNTVTAVTDFHTKGRMQDE